MVAEKPIAEVRVGDVLRVPARQLVEHWSGLVDVEVVAITDDGRLLVSPDLEENPMAWRPGPTVNFVGRADLEG